MMLLTFDNIRFSNYVYIILPEEVPFQKWINISFNPPAGIDLIFIRKIDNDCCLYYSKKSSCGGLKIHIKGMVVRHNYQNFTKNLYFGKITLSISGNLSKLTKIKLIMP